MAIALPVVLPQETLLWDETREAKNGQGWECYGGGSIQPADNSFRARWINEDATVIRRASVLANPLIHARGGNFELGRFAVVGETETKTGVGVLVFRQNGFNGAKGLIYDVAFRGFDSGITVGKPGTSGNDNLTIQRCLFAHCRAAVTLDSRQSMHHLLSRIHVRDCDIVLDVSGGGKTDIDGLDMGCKGTLLNVAGSGRRVGPNNGHFDISNVTIDGHGDSMCMVSALDDGSVVNATLSRLDWPSQVGGRIPKARMRLTGRNQRVTLAAHNNLPPDTLFTLSGGATVVLKDMRLPTNPNNLIGPDSDSCRLVIRDCWRFSGRNRIEYINCEVVR